ncbi:MAG: FHA domain-containing protein [Verrucomicrobiota bacterium]|nr:FHA domain-containing protein [Verrucomicrobiota bacterium]
MKASLLVLQAEKAPASFPIASPQASVGRAAGENIRIDDDTVSDQHATIFVNGGNILLEDAGSSHGTYVNGLRIARAELKNADRLRFGLVEAVIQCEPVVLPDPGSPKLDATIAELDAARKERDAHSQKHTEALGKISELERQIALVTKNRETLHAQNLKSIGDLAKQHAAIARLTEEADRAKLEAEQLTMQVDEAKAQFDATTRERDASRTEIEKLKAELVDARTEISGLTAEREAAKKFRAEAEAKNNEAQTLIQSFAKERDAAFAIRDEKTRELTALASELASAQSQSEKATAEREQLSRDLETAKAAAARAQTERESLQQQHDLATAEAVQAQNHVKSVLLTVDSVNLKNQELTTQIEGLRDSNATLNGELGRASLEIESLTRNRLDVEQRTAHLTAEIERRLAELQKSHAENFELQAALAEKSARLAQAESDADFFARERDKTFEDLQRASIARDQWQSAVAAQNALAAQLAQARASIEQVQAGMVTAAQEVERLQAEAQLPKPPKTLGPAEPAVSSGQEAGDAVQNTVSWLNRGLTRDGEQPQQAEGEVAAVSAP